VVGSRSQVKWQPRVRALGWSGAGPVPTARSSMNGLGTRAVNRGIPPVPASMAVTGEQATPDPAVTAARVVPAGDSAEQRGAERVMLDLLGSQLGLELNPDTITVPSGERVQVDGADASRTVLAECWAHQGAPKSVQKHKVLADAFKLAWIATTIYPRPRLILCLSDPLAAGPFLPGARS